MSLSHRGLHIVVRNPPRVFPPAKAFSNLGRSVMKQVEGALQPIADDALRDDGDHVCVIDNILGHIHHRHLSSHQGMV